MAHAYPGVPVAVTLPAPWCLVEERAEFPTAELQFVREPLSVAGATDPFLSVTVEDTGALIANGDAAAATAAAVSALQQAVADAAQGPSGDGGGEYGLLQVSDVTMLSPQQARFVLRTSGQLVAARVDIYCKAFPGSSLVAAVQLVRPVSDIDAEGYVAPEAADAAGFNTACLRTVPVPAGPAARRSVLKLPGVWSVTAPAGLSIGSVASCAQLKATLPPSAVGTVCCDTIGADTSAAPDWGVATFTVGSDVPLTVGAAEARLSVFETMAPLGWLPQVAPPAFEADAACLCVAALGSMSAEVTRDALVFVHAPRLHDAVGRLACAMVWAKRDSDGTCDAAKLRELARRLATANDLPAGEEAARLLGDSVSLDVDDGVAFTTAADDIFPLGWQVVLPSVGACRQMVVPTGAAAGEGVGANGIARIEVAVDDLAVTATDAIEAAIVESTGPASHHGGGGRLLEKDGTTCGVLRPGVDGKGGFCLTLVVVAAVETRKIGTSTPSGRWSRILSSTAQGDGAPSAPAGVVVLTAHVATVFRRKEGDEAPLAACRRVAKSLRRLVEANAGAASPARNR
jgi:hypothetical protein